LQTPVSQKSATRLESIDLMRGLVMVVMALDHVRDFFSNVQHDPTDLAKTSAILFLTRWITHYCAPTFMFLAGTSAFLYGSRGRTTGELSRFLLTRGLWLVFLELTWVRFGWTFNWNFGVTNVGATIWAIGWSMVTLSALVYLPMTVIAVFGLGLIFFHNAFDAVKPEAFGSLGWVWQVLHAGGTFPVMKEIPVIGGSTYVASYPLIPWLGVMAIGYVFGQLYTWPAERRQQWLIGLGTAMIALFLTLRLPNLYGDLAHWSPQPVPFFSLFSVLNCTKYPPSLLYLLMTLGPVMFLLCLFERVHTGPIRPLLVFGRVPMFYYLLHLPLIHGLALLIEWVLGRQGAVKLLAGSSPFNGLPDDYGFSLAAVYVVWITLILSLYWPCRWFMELKSRRRDWWLSYL
jgi:uncharacterized membrane protein